jgi:hypothetical protein
MLLQQQSGECQYTAARATGAQQQRNQLCLGERLGTERAEAFARSIPSGRCRVACAR